MPYQRRRPAALVLTIISILVLTACASDGAQKDPDGGSSKAGAAFPVDVLSGPQNGDNTTITVAAEPEAIVSLSPTATEMLWAVGAGDQVVAVDDQSDYPEGVPTTKLSGYKPNIEAILSYEPDLVIASSDAGDLVSALQKAKVPTLLLPSAADLDESYSQIERIGAATGHVAEAAKLVSEMRSDIKKAVDSVSGADGLTYYHELDPTNFTVTGDTFIGEVYALFAMTSIADAADTKDAYPKLSSEYIVEADPDVIMLADGQCCGVTPEKIGNRAGWSQMSAVRNDRTYTLDEDIASRWGPRVVDFVQRIAEIVKKSQPATTG